MKIVIAGAGGVGFHLAKLLCSEKQEITLIDTNPEVLEYASSHIDVLTVLGDSSSLATLQTAGISNSDMFIAVTVAEKNNMFSCILAKKMGVRHTIARVDNPEFLTEEQRANFKELGIDAMFSPVQLAAKEIFRLIKQEVVTDIFEFEEGKLIVTGFTIDRSSSLVNRKIADINEEYEGKFKPIALLRGAYTYLPRENTVLLPKDHVYFISKNHGVDELKDLVGKPKRQIKNIMIIGGGQIGFHTASLLEKDYNVTIVEREKSICKDLIEGLHNTLVIKGDYSNLDLLKEEGLDNMDGFIAVTDNTETNIISSLVSLEHGLANKTVALVENMAYIHISQNIGVDTLINKKLIAANYIFRYVRKGNIEAIASLHGVDAEVIEFAVTKNNRLTRFPIRKLKFPKKSIVGAVVRGDEALFVDGDFQIMLGDKVIVIALPEAISSLDKLFR